MINRRTIFNIIAVILALALGAVAIFTAYKLAVSPTVSPTVPQAKPHAAEPTFTPACRVSFTVAPRPSLKCESVTLTPNDTNIVGGFETRTLTASASGGVLPYTYTWSLSSASVDKGNLSSTNGRVVNWTGPGTIISSENWTITAKVKDADGNLDSSNCVVTLNANPPAQVCGSSCNSKTGCPQGLGCVNGVCRNVSCPTEPSCSCPAPSATCNSACTDSSQCPSNLACSNGFCRNPSCTTQTDCVCPPPAAPQTHKACQNNACVTVSGAGPDTCTSDVSCRPKAVAPPIPESGIELPTILGIVGGTGLLLIGLLAIL